MLDVFENFGRFGRFEKVVVPLKILNTLNTYFLSVKESNKEKLFSFQILPLFEARCRLRRPPSHKAAAGQAAVGGWLGMTYNREFKEFREFREFAVDCTLSQAYIFAPA